MTEQEAEVWAARLTRIWEPQKAERYFRYGSPTDAFNHAGYICDDIRLEIEDDDGMAQGELFFELYIGHTSSTIHTSTASTTDGIGDGSAYCVDEFSHSSMNRLNEWIPFFSRGCWLSGCAIEATAHEKAEWMQGFTREELDAWNLKI